MFGGGFPSYEAMELFVRYPSELSVYWYFCRYWLDVLKFVLE